MAANRKMELSVVGFVIALGWVFDSGARAQVAFVPGIGEIPTGATMTVTPAVSADRRYVRLSVNPFFNVLNGFTAIPVFGAVGGGNFGGFGGFGGFAGMNGLVDQSGAGATAATGAGILDVVGDESLAGPLPVHYGLPEFGPPPLMGDPLNPAATARQTVPEAAAHAAELVEPAPAFERAGNPRSARSTKRHPARQRRTLPRKSSRRQPPTAAQRPVP
jgi:hypothetical protein